MRLDLIAETPVVVTVGNERWRVPPFTVYDFLDWGRREDGAVTDAACAGMSPDSKFQYVSMYGLVTHTPIEELRPQVKKEGGAAVVCGVCLPRSTVIERDGQPVGPDKNGNPERVPRERAAEVARTMTTACRLALAAMLCPEPPTAEGDKAAEPEAEKGEGAGPLPGTRTGGSAA